MNILFDQILHHREAAALPSLSESGGLPALISGLSAVHRANLAAALRSRTGRPLVVICPDDTAAETFARDLSSMLGEEAVTLEDVYEPYLMQIGFLSRTPRGRCVTQLAYDHLGITYLGQQQMKL